MSISEMTQVSYFFEGLAALSGAAALMMFFVYDIRQCWQILRGKRTDAPAAKKKGAKQGAKTEKLGKR